MIFRDNYVFYICLFSTDYTCKVNECLYDVHEPIYLATSKGAS